MRLLTNTLALLLTFTFFGCIEERSSFGENFQEFSTVGAFPKLVALESNFFDFSDLENATYAHSVDFVDGREGKEVEKYRIYISYQQPDQDTMSFELFRTVGSHEFVTRSGTDQLGFDLIIPFPEVATFLGISDLSDFSSEDEFNFQTEIVRADERVFSSLNSTPAITNSFGGLWNFKVKGGCPLQEDMFVGDYQIRYGYVYEPDERIGIEGRAFGNTLDRTVSLSPTHDPLKRVLNYGTYLEFFTDDVSLHFSCGNLFQLDIRTGVSCGEGVIGAIQNGIATYDPNDDSTFTIELIDWPPELDGGCSNASGLDLRYSIVFTKI
jgi:hypothetical protein